MNEKDLVELWNKSRNQLIFAQLAPTFLLITTAGLVSEVRSAGTFTVVAVLGILLASGILGALVEYSAAHEAQAIARDIKDLKTGSRISKSIAQTAPWLHLAKYLTPAIFVAIFVALFITLVF
jgi:membrane protein DedA with SNARE-associated domain